VSSTGTAIVTVNGGAAAASVSVSIEPSPVYQRAPDADGYQWRFTVRLTETAGVATSVTGLVINGSDESKQLSGMFGSSQLSARGTLAATMRANIATVPAERLFVFSGTDAGGRNWSRQATVKFEGKQNAAGLSLSSVPATVRQTNSGLCSAEYPLFQELVLQETNGIGVRLTKFVSDGSDFSSQIAGWFGSLRLAPYGVLRGRICWKADGLPSTRSYEVEGVDAGGQTVNATLQVSFKTAALIPGTLAVSKSSLELYSANGTATGSLNVTLPGDEAWSVRVLQGNQKV
jgi:hypothetical protein